MFKFFDLEMALWVYGRGICWGSELLLQHLNLLLQSSYTSHKMNEYVLFLLLGFSLYLFIHLSESVLFRDSLDYVPGINYLALHDGFGWILGCKISQLPGFIVLT